MSKLQFQLKETFDVWHASGPLLPSYGGNCCVRTKTIPKRRPTKQEGYLQIAVISGGCTAICFRDKYNLI